MIEAGKLKSRIQIQAKGSARGSFGEQVTSWTTFANVWAGKLLLTAKEVDRQQGQEGKAEVKFLIRYLAGLTTAMRVQYKGEFYYITSIEEYGVGEGQLVFVRRTV